MGRGFNQEALVGLSVTGLIVLEADNRRIGLAYYVQGGTVQLIDGTVVAVVVFWACRILRHSGMLSGADVD